MRHLERQLVEHIEQADRDDAERREMNPRRRRQDADGRLGEQLALQRQPETDRGTS